MEIVSILLPFALLALGAAAWVFVRKHSAAAEVRQQKVAANKRLKFSRDRPAEAQADIQKRSRVPEFGRR